MATKCYFRWSYNLLAPFVQKLDRAFYQINLYLQWISIRETNCTVHWIEIYTVDSTIQLWTTGARPLIILKSIGNILKFLIHCRTMINPALHNLINENQSKLWSLWWWQWVGVGGEPRVLIQFLSSKTAPKRNNTIINVVSPESLAYQRTKFTSFPKDQSNC